MKLFGRDLVRSLVLGFVLGSAAMISGFGVAVFGIGPAQAAPADAAAIALAVR
jgi:hypothetical protein